MIKIATDSTCDLPPEFYRQYDIAVVPINIFFGTEGYLDGVTIDRPTFYRKIEELGILPKTSQPSAGQFEEAYNHLAAQGATDIISLHVGAKMSGTFQSAEMAREMVAGRVRVHTFDSAGGSAGMGFMVLEALRMVDAGKTVAEIMARLEAIRPRINILLTVRDLRFAQMSGRIGRLQASLSSLLNIKPIIVLRDGLLSVGDKVRTQSKAIDQMVNMMTDRLGTLAPVNLAAIHAEAPEAAQALIERARALFDCQESFVADLAASLAVHFGPGTVGLVGYRP
ncbi:MAG: DegV family protein [Anaerolineae bacterium]|nr:DegV family protein [Anaerolineae bacterium]